MSLRSFPALIIPRASAPAAVAAATLPRQRSATPPATLTSSAVTAESSALPYVAVAAALELRLPSDLGNTTIAYGPVPPVPNDVARHEMYNDSTARVIYYFAALQPGQVNRS